MAHGSGGDSQLKKGLKQRTHFREDPREGRDRPDPEVVISFIDAHDFPAG
jgi:hypothetical protein